MLDKPIFIVGIVLLMVLALLLFANIHTSDSSLLGATILFLVISLALAYYWLKHMHEENK
jgi:hypothetical protein